MSGDKEDFWARWVTEDVQNTTTVIEFTDLRSPDSQCIRQVHHNTRETVNACEAFRDPVGTCFSVFCNQHLYVHQENVHLTECCTGVVCSMFCVYRETEYHHSLSGPRRLGRYFCIIASSQSDCPFTLMQTTCARTFIFIANRLHALRWH